MHPYLLRENNITCKLLKAASLYFASKLFKGKKSNIKNQTKKLNRKQRQNLLE